jgi:transitional endoplasmic reticulum ATPase
MLERMFPLRPDLDTSVHAGFRVTVVDAAGILAAPSPVELLHGADLGPPVQEASLTLARDGDYVLDGLVRTGTPRGLSVLGNDPVGVFIGRRVAAGEPWATRVVDGIDDAVASVSRRLGLESAPPAPDGPVLRTDVREDGLTGLRATVTWQAQPDDGRLIRLYATVSPDVMATAHLQAMCRLLLDVVVETGVRRPVPLVLSATADSPDQVTLDQVGGLPDQVAELRQVAVSFRHPAAMARWGARRPQGILLYGPPGTGKTMLARALANEIGATFREIRTPEILDKYLGASERNIKRIFRDARRYREPTVMLFDEFDSIISYAGEGGDAASQAVNAVAGIFKQEMNDLVEENPNVIVIATTNFPQRVDQSLIRSGRFDVKMSIPLPDAAGRAQIIGKMIRHLIVQHEVDGFQMFADDLDLDELANSSAGMTGADIKEVLRRAQLAKAMAEARTGTPPTPIDQQDMRVYLSALRSGTAA